MNMDPRLKHPFTCLVAGPTGCGKSVFVSRLIQHMQNMMYPVPEKVMWCYGEWQALYDTLLGVE